MKKKSWNCQGCGKPATKDYLKHCLQKYNPDIVFLSETKTKTHKMNTYLRQTNYPNYWFASSVSLSGGIALAWKDGFYFEIMHATRHMVNIIVKSGPNNQDDY